MFFISTTSSRLGQRSLMRGKSHIEILGLHSSSFSSTTSTQKKNEPSSSFRPRRRTPKPFHSSPTFKSRSKKATDPIKLTHKDVTHEKKYGDLATDALRHVQRIKKEKGGIHPDTIFPSAEETMRAADYLTADVGTTEDLVGERRAMMDAWDDEQAKEFQKNLDEILEENSEMSYYGELPWNRDQNEKEEESMGVGNKHRAGMLTDMESSEGDPFQKAFGPWSDTIVRVDRVQKVQRGGTMVRYRALVIGGNLNGCAGFGVAKANAPNEAAEAAARIAKRNIFFVDRYMNSGLTNDLVGRHNSCKVTLRSVNPNRGLHGHPLILEILKYFGISDCSAKSHGNRNVYNVVYATFKAIMTHESLEDVAMKRGKRLLNLERAKRLNI